MSADAICTTGSISHNAWATADESDGDGTSLEEILEATDCVGDVSVSRGETNLAAENGAYVWLVTFLRDADAPCQQVGSDSLCNSPGDVPKFSEVDSNSEDLLGTSARNLVYGDGDSTHGAITVLDAADNSTRPPGAPEVQTIRVYDLELTASDKFDGNPGFTLSLGGNTSGCISWNSSAASVATVLSETSVEYAENIVVSARHKSITSVICMSRLICFRCCQGINVGPAMIAGKRKHTLLPPLPTPRLGRFLAKSCLSSMNANVNDY